MTCRHGQQRSSNSATLSPSSSSQYVARPVMAMTGRHGCTGHEGSRAGGEWPVRGDETQAVDPALGEDDLIGPAVLPDDPRDDVDGVVADDAQRPPDVLGMHDHLAEHRDLREGPVRSYW